MQRIESITAFVVEDDTGEGVAAFLGPKGMWLPMVAADPERVASLRPHAEAIVKASGKRIRVVRFTTRTELDVIEP